MRKPCVAIAHVVRSATQDKARFPRSPFVGNRVHRSKHAFYLTLPLFAGMVYCAADPARGQQKSVSAVPIYHGCL
jgi:hypothetical protein